MKSNIKNKIKFFLLLGLIVSFSLRIVLNTNMNLEDANKISEFGNPTNLKHSGYWNLTGDPILIDNNGGTAGSITWATAAADKPWCTKKNGVYIIENVTIDGEGSSNCIEIKDSSDPFIIKNCTVYNAGTTYAGIFLNYADDGIIIQNEASNGNNYGIHLWNSFNITVSGNTANNNDYGIEVGGGECNITGNTANNNAWHGLEINSIFDCSVSGNTFNSNTGDGIFLMFSDGNDVSGNNMEGNNVGAKLYDCETNFIWNNTFIGNNINADDEDGNSNVWDFLTLGNYWDDYGGKDTDDDGVGDSYYFVSGNTGSRDNYPTWWDPPVFSITSPGNGNKFSTTPPHFTISSDEGIIDESWYTLDDGITNKSFSGLSGDIDSSEWSSADDGPVTLKFYVNDSRDEIDFNEVLVIKDTTFPIITIDSPTPNELFGSKTPDFTLSITEANAYTTWYTLDDGITNITFTGLTGDIDPTEWSSAGDGPVTIKFYVNDTIGNVAFDEVTILKESIIPIISIESPSMNEIFRSIAPGFSISVIEVNMNTTWYTLDGGLTNITFTGLTGDIDPTEWSSADDGPITIRFYINDTAGNIDFDEISVIKDTTDPIISIDSPLPDDLFGILAPGFSLSITEANSYTTWYTLDNGITNITFTGLTGDIEPSEWSSASDGPITIKFYINDTVGNIAFDEVIIQKDGTAPVITINSPSVDERFEFMPPTYSITITDVNKNTTWYTLDGGITNIIFTGSSGDIDPTAWSSADIGPITIRFYANDTAGNIGFEEVIIHKEPEAPTIMINSPSIDEFFGTNAPSFSVNITDISLETTWYTIDGGIINITFTGMTGDINQDAWNSIPDGAVTIRFCANDTDGNIGFEEVTIVKDSIDPIIIMNLYEEHEFFGHWAPYLYTNITDDNLNAAWYTLDGGITNISLDYLLIGADYLRVNQIIWDLISDISVTLTVYANDSVGNIGLNQITKVKDGTLPSITIYSPSNDQRFDAPPDFDVTITDANLLFTYYSFDDQTTEINFTGTVGTIDQELWDALPLGTVRLWFSGKDGGGNEVSKAVSIVKIEPDEPEPPPTPSDSIGFNGVMFAIIGMSTLGIIATSVAVTNKKNRSYQEA